MGFHWYEYVFWLFKVTLKMVTEPLYKGSREFSVLSQWRQFFFGKVLKTVCFDCEMLLFWRKLLKAVCFGQNPFFLGIAGKNSRF